MKRIISIFLAVVMVFALAACAGTQEGSDLPVNDTQNESRFIHDISPTQTNNNAGIERWEYTVFYLDRRIDRGDDINDLIEQLNGYGIEGWELVNHAFDSNSAERNIFTFKRRLS
ncbi:MAG: YgdI/YgdR family lipoprotein [Oscillospiraceae bacterium]|nr:YgdI/YgdR family lipoprotein [Oscillospiraceae bacterium]